MPVSARTHVLFGAWVKPQDNQTPQDALAAMESEIGRTYDVYHYYHGWQNPLLSDQGLWASSHGSKLLINWKAALEWSGGEEQRRRGGIRSLGGHRGRQAGRRHPGAGP